MRSVLMSIQPKWCDLIALGKKTIEIRKSRPKLQTPFKVYIYCTEKDYDKIFCPDKFMSKAFINGNGKQKVVGEFTCSSIDDYSYTQAFNESMGCFINRYVYDITPDEIKQSCLSYEDLENYGNTKILFGWHISDLIMYDIPRDLSKFHRECEYERECGDCPYLYVENTPSCYETWCEVDGKLPIKNPPQSWCYVDGMKTCGFSCEYVDLIRCESCSIKSNCAGYTDCVLELTKEMNTDDERI